MKFRSGNRGEDPPPAPFFLLHHVPKTRFSSVNNSACRSILASFFLHPIQFKVVTTFFGSPERHHFIDAFKDYLWVV